MIQLKVFTNEVINGWEQSIMLDLYEEDLPKLTISIEDITTTKTTTSFSRAFRVPATNNNTVFFKTAFEINGYDFDVTVARKAHILFDGNIFKNGEIRLQKIIKNDTTGKIDYEIIFLGDVVNLATQIGSATLRQLDLSNLNHINSHSNIVSSWQAYPQNGFNNLNDGLLNGDVIYPLVNFGNTYNDNGTTNETQIISGVGNPLNVFTSAIAAGLPTSPIDNTSFRPMVRAKVIWDKIFEGTDYTYSSNFLNSNIFRQLYVSAWGNDATPILDLDEISTDISIAGNIDTWSIPLTISTSNVLHIDKILYGDVLPYDFNNYTYTVPLSGAYLLSYNIPVVVNGQANGGLTLIVKTHRIRNGITTEIDLNLFSIVINSGNNGLMWLTNDTLFDDTSQFNTQIGDIIYYTVTNTGASNVSSVSFKNRIGNIEASYTFKHITTLNEININLSTLLDKKYKQIDFLRDIITKFRLVLTINTDVNNGFIIEPWKSYIGSGPIRDWTHILDEMVDIKLEPVYNKQVSKITFTDKAGDDYLNTINTGTFNEVYGTLNLEVFNAISYKSRKIETKIITTPVTQILNGNRGQAGMGGCIIPQIHKQGIEFDNSSNVYIRNEPIVPGTHILFYDGLKSTGINSQNIREWFSTDGTNTSIHVTFPMVSQFSEWPLDTQTVDLSWQRENTFIKFDMADVNKGNSCYTEYWSSYINTLYDKWSRRLTANFVLSSDDLLNFSFDDVIFVKDAYYYVEKIYDVIIGQSSSVKVDLIKLLDYHPPVTDFIPVATPWEDVTSLWNNVTPLWEDV